MFFIAVEDDNKLRFARAVLFTGFSAIKFLAPYLARVWCYRTQWWMECFQTFRLDSVVSNFTSGRIAMTGVSKKKAFCLFGSFHLQLERTHETRVSCTVYCSSQVLLSRGNNIFGALVRYGETQEWSSAPILQCILEAEYSEKGGCLHYEESEILQSVQWMSSLHRFCQSFIDQQETGWHSFSKLVENI